MSTPKAKPYKLKPSDGIMTRDDVSLWEYTLLASCRQIADWLKFLPGGENSTWCATDEDATNGLNNVTVAVQTKLRNDFANFLTCVATHCPTGFMDTVMRESTSFKTIVAQIKTTYGLDSKGEKFLSCIDIKLEFSPTFTYEQGYMTTKDFFMSAMLPNGARFKNKVLTTAETLSPLAENFIMKEFLLKVHPKLPEHIKNTKGHLFTTERPTLACNKAILIDLMDTMLAEIDGVDNIAASNVCVGQLGQARSFRGRGGAPRFPYRGSGNSRGGSSSFRGGQRNSSRGSRPPFPGRFLSQGRREDCSHCVEARMFDSSKGHVSSNCPFKMGLATPYQQSPYQQRSYQSNQPQSNGFKVLLVQDQSAYQSQLPESSTFSPLLNVPMNESPAMQSVYDQSYYPNSADGQYDQYQEVFGGEYDDTYYDPAYHGYNSHL